MKFKQPCLEEKIFNPPWYLALKLSCLFSQLWFPLFLSCLGVQSRADQRGEIVISDQGLRFLKLTQPIASKLADRAKETTLERADFALQLLMFVTGKRGE